MTLELAAMKYCAANTRLGELRQLWRQVKRDHSGEDICCRGWNRADAADWCDVCKAYPLAEYRSALQTRRSAARSMMTRYGHILKLQSKVAA